jgi:hypothetical protein
MLGAQPSSPFRCVSQQKLWKIHRVTVSLRRCRSALSRRFAGQRDGGGARRFDNELLTSLELEAAGGIEPPYGALQLQKRGSQRFA